MRNNNGTLSSTCGNVNDVIGGRKAIESRYTLVQSVAACEGMAGGAVLIDMGRDDAVVFSDEAVEGAPFLTETESDEEEEEEEWDSEEESEEEDAEDAELNAGLAERRRILADARALKHLAGAFLRPEQPVATDGAAFGRNFFHRYSAAETSDCEDEVASVDGKDARACFADERAEVLAEVAALKQSAVDYLHPEVGVTATAGAAFGRNYFLRPSAPEVESAEDADGRALVLAEAVALKKSAVDYMHPEAGVTSAAGASFGRSYFNRYSAPETEEDDFADERAEVLAEAAALQKLAVDYMHPEVGVVATDGTLFGRNYFLRPSAPETAEVEDAEEVARVMTDALALKKAAMDYMHPEVGVAPTVAACGRNYFNRYSAAETADCKDEVASVSEKDARAWFADERAEVLAEAAALKKSAMDYMHPEAGVSSAAGTCCGRNYFNRYSAPETEEDDFADERAEVLAEAVALKKLAVDYMHPEVGVVATDGTLFGRNYFLRASAPETEEVEDAEEVARVMADALALKKAAMDYMHPEVGVVPTDAACGRNYFNRYSAAETADCKDEVASVSEKDARAWFADERAEVLAEAAALKKSAVDYLHPEVGVVATDGTAFGRNYFNRYSAPEVESAEDADERAEVLAEAVAFKKSAVDYMHPEAGVTSAGGASFGRNYFNRYSAPETEEDGLADERAKVFAEASALKNLATVYMHPEVGITATDGAAFGRNFFNRYSAPEVEQKAESPEESQDVAVVKNLAAAVKGANLPGTESTKFSSSDQEVGETKKSVSSVNLFGLSTGMF